MTEPTIALPRVTVVIAAYRDHEYFDRTVRSALDQSFDGLEVLISDDSPTRATHSAYLRHAHDPRVRYRHNRERLGPAGNHWAAFREARAPYVAILNHDDLLRPGHLEALVPRLEQDDDLAAAFCDHDVIDARGDVLPEETSALTHRYGRDRLAPGIHRDLHAMVLAQTMPLAIGSVLRRSVLVGRPLPRVVAGAYDLYLSILLAAIGAAVYYEPRRLSAWRVHPASLTSSADPAWLYGAAQAWRMAATAPGLAPHRAAFVRRAVRSCATVGRVSLARRNWPMLARSVASAVDSLAASVLTRPSALE